MIRFKQFIQKLLKEEEESSGDLTDLGDFSFNDEIGTETNDSNDTAHNKIHSNKAKKTRASIQNQRLRYMSFHRMSKPTSQSTPRLSKKGTKGKSKSRSKKREKINI